MIALQHFLPTRHAEANDGTDIMLSTGTFSLPLLITELEERAEIQRLMEQSYHRAGVAVWVTCMPVGGDYIVHVCNAEGEAPFEIWSVLRLALGRPQEIDCANIGGPVTVVYAPPEERPAPEVAV